jgi:protein-L-isoaspartate(D-aspartate) O-methyltransferase
VTAAPPKVPEALEDQLKIGGRMIVPVGDAFQELVLIVRERRRFRKKKLLPVRFVPLVRPH